MTKILNYQPFLDQILAKIQSARYEMLKAVSKQTVLLYLDIGKSVSNQMQDKGWGKLIVEKLSKDLQREFPGIRGFSASNIWRMKTFYETYKENEKLAPLVREIGWVQNCIIIEKCKNDIQREYYLKKTNQMGWSKLDLIDKIKHHHFENQSLAQNNFNTTISNDLKAQVAWEFVDDYNIELISPDQPFSEKEKDVGQVKWYMELVNKQIKEKNHNSTIGIVLCKNKDRMMVEYMLENTKDPVGVATYNRYEELPQEFAKFLPSEKEIIKRLTNINFLDKNKK